MAAFLQTHRALLLLVGLAGLAAPATADATYSVVATDSSVTHVGGAGTSCVGALDVTIILGTAPGWGAVHAQAQINTNGRDQAVALLAQGETPADIIAAITAANFDFNSASRQYGVVDLKGQAAGFTGATNGAVALDQQGTDGPYTYSVQGNILTSAAVVENAEDGFVNGGGCDLPDKLMLALEAGALNGEGDSRCTDDGIPADSAFIRVVDQTGAVVIGLTVTDTAPMSPLVALRAEYDAWRAMNPCPAGGTTGGTGGSDGTGGSTGDVTDTGSGTGGSTTTGSSAGSDSATDGSGGATSTGMTGGTGSLTAGSGGETDGAGGGSSGDDKGCACFAGPTGPSPWLLAPLALVLRRRRE